MEEELFCLRQNLKIILKSEKNKSKQYFFQNSSRQVLPYYIFKILKKEFGPFIPKSKLLYKSELFFKDSSFLFSFYAEVNPYLICEISKDYKGINLNFLGLPDKNYFINENRKIPSIAEMLIYKNDSHKEVILNISSKILNYKRPITLPGNSQIILPDGFKVNAQNLNSEKLFLSNFHCLKFYEVLKQIKNLKSINLLDYGCGKGDFIAYCKKELPNSNLYGYDKTRYTNQVESNGGIPVQNLEDIKVQIDTITMIEVIEHITPTLHQDTVDKILNLSPQNIIITTPIFSDMGLTHFDHKFEWTKTQFQEWISEYFPKYSIQNHLTIQHPLKDRAAQLIKLEKRS